MVVRSCVGGHKRGEVDTSPCPPDGCIGRGPAPHLTVCCVNDMLPGLDSVIRAWLVSQAGVVCAQSYSWRVVVVLLKALQDVLMT